MDKNLILIVLVAFLGGIVSALMGWAGSIPAEPFNVRKFIITAGTSLIVGAVYAATLYTPSGNFTKDLLVALAFVGTGGDALVNRAVGAVQAKLTN